MSSSEGLITRGKEALAQVARQKPAWGKESRGLQVGISRLGEEDQFKAGERVPLEFYIRNTSDKTLTVTINVQQAYNLALSNLTFGTPLIGGYEEAAQSQRLLEPSAPPPVAFGAGSRDVMTTMISLPSVVTS